VADASAGVGEEAAAADEYLYVCSCGACNNDACNDDGECAGAGALADAAAEPVLRLVQKQALCFRHRQIAGCL